MAWLDSQRIGLVRHIGLAWLDSQTIGTNIGATIMGAAEAARLVLLLGTRTYGLKTTPSLRGLCGASSSATSQRWLGLGQPIAVVTAS